MEKITKTEKLNKIENILTMHEGDEIQMLIDFVQAEKAALARKAEKAKERAAEKKTEVSELGEAVFAALTDAPMTGDEVFALVENSFEDATLAKVRAQLTKLFNAGRIDKTEVKVEVNGKKTTRMAYALIVTTDAE